MSERELDMFPFFDCGQNDIQPLASENSPEAPNIEDIEEEEMERINGTMIAIVSKADGHQMYQNTFQDSGIDGSHSLTRRSSLLLHNSRNASSPYSLKRPYASSLPPDHKSRRTYEDQSERPKIVTANTTGTRVQSFPQSEPSSRYTNHPIFKNSQGTHRPETIIGQRSNNQRVSCSYENQQQITYVIQDSPPEEENKGIPIARQSGRCAEQAPPRSLQQSNSSGLSESMENICLGEDVMDVDDRADGQRTVWQHGQAHNKVSPRVEGRLTDMLQARHAVSPEEERERSREDNKPGEDEETKKEKIKEKNRFYAKKSRDKKKEKIESLEKKCSEQQATIEIYKKTVSIYHFRQHGAYPDWHKVPLKWYPSQTTNGEAFVNIECDLPAHDASLLKSLGNNASYGNVIEHTPIKSEPAEESSTMDQGTDLQLQAAVSHLTPQRASSISADPRSKQEPADDTEVCKKEEHTRYNFPQTPRKCSPMFTPNSPGFVDESPSSQSKMSEQSDISHVKSEYNVIPQSAKFVTSVVNPLSKMQADETSDKTIDFDGFSQGDTQRVESVQHRSNSYIICPDGQLIHLPDHVLRALKLQQQQPPVKTHIVGPQIHKQTGSMPDAHRGSAVVKRELFSDANIADQNSDVKTPISFSSVTCTQPSHSQIPTTVTESSMQGINKYSSQQNTFSNTVEHRETITSKMSEMNPQIRDVTMTSPNSAITAPSVELTNDQPRNKSRFEPSGNGVIRYVILPESIAGKGQPNHGQMRGLSLLPNPDASDEGLQFAVSPRGVCNERGEDGNDPKLELLEEKVSWSNLPSLDMSAFEQFTADNGTDIE